MEARKHSYKGAALLEVQTIEVLKNFLHLNHLIILLIGETWFPIKIQIGLDGLINENVGHKKSFLNLISKEWATNRLKLRTPEFPFYQLKNCKHLFAELFISKIKGHLLATVDKSKRLKIRIFLFAFFDHQIMRLTQCDNWVNNGVHRRSDSYYCKFVWLYYTRSEFRSIIRQIVVLRLTHGSNCPSPLIIRFT